MTIFDLLAIIDFESSRTDYDVLTKHYKYDHERLNQDRFYLSRESLLFRIWWFLFRATPSYSMLDRILSKFLRNHISIGNFTWYGYNAMMWAMQWRGEYKGRLGVWLFRPPCFMILGRRGFSMGRLYFSPDGTPSHPKATLFWGAKRTF